MCVVVTAFYYFEVCAFPFSLNSSEMLKHPTDEAFLLLYFIRTHTIYFVVCSAPQSVQQNYMFVVILENCMSSSFAPKEKKMIAPHIPAAASAAFTFVF